MTIIIKNISYIHPNREILFQNINISIDIGEKISLIGKNGSGKSTLLQIVTGVLQPSEGEIISSESPYYIPQHFGQYNNLTVSQALGIDKKLNALYAILNGDASANNFTALDDDWSIEEKALSALSLWGLQHISLSRKIELLSGGEKTKVFLSGIAIHSPSVIVMDEPSNHLDKAGREQLYKLIQTSKSSLIVVSHDRTLLNLIDTTCELGKNKVEFYGGNYNFYKLQKDKKINTLLIQLSEKEKQLCIAREMAKETIARKQKQDSHGKKNNLKQGFGKAAMDAFEDKAEKSASRLRSDHLAKISDISDELINIHQKIPETIELKLDFDNANIRTGKTLIDAENINFEYSSALLWKKSLSFQIRSGERIVINGHNGVGKTTLIKLIVGKLNPAKGTIARADFKYLYLDQEYSIIDNYLTVFEQAQQFNKQNLPEHEIKMRLNRYMFPSSTWDKTCNTLSGGEKIKLVFCCLAISNNTPDMFILDEPSNNLDIQSLETIVSVIKAYKGTVLLISHDQYFINEIRINKEINLDFA